MPEESAGQAAWEEAHPELMSSLTVPDHAFDPGGRAHWSMPRCAVKVCREFKDHPVHAVDTLFCACDPTGMAQEWHPGCPKVGKR